MRDSYNPFKPRGNGVPLRIEGKIIEYKTPLITSKLRNNFIVQYPQNYFPGFCSSTNY
jgi:hypothetical protein